MISVYTLAAWSVIVGLAFISVGGLVLWAYGMGRRGTAYAVDGPEAEAVRMFHTSLSRWFFAYGAGVIVIGAGFLLWASSILF